MFCGVIASWKLESRPDFKRLLWTEYWYSKLFRLLWKFLNITDVCICLLKIQLQNKILSWDYQLKPKLEWSALKCAHFLPKIKCVVHRRNNYDDNDCYHEDDDDCVLGRECQRKIKQSRGTSARRSGSISPYSSCSSSKSTTLNAPRCAAPSYTPHSQLSSYKNPTFFGRNHRHQDTWPHVSDVTIPILLFIQVIVSIRALSSSSSSRCTCTQCSRKRVQPLKKTYKVMFFWIFKKTLKTFEKRNHLVMQPLITQLQVPVSHGHQHQTSCSKVWTGHENCVINDYKYP